MKYICELTNELDIQKVKEFKTIEYVMVGLAGFSMDSSLELSVKEINDFNLDGLKLIVNIERIVNNREIEILDMALKALDLNKIAYFMYSDLGVYELLCKHHLQDKTFYRSSTYVTNSCDLEYFLKLNSKVCVSSEISSEELANIISKYHNIAVDAFGQNIIFYSRRPLLSNYFKYRHSLKKPFRKDYTIVEEQRTEPHRIIETPYYTVIYEPHHYYLKEELECGKDDLLGIIYAKDLSNEDYLKVLEAYNSKQEFKDLNVTLYKGAYDIKSCLLKSEASNE